VTTGVPAAVTAPQTTAPQTTTPRSGTTTEPAPVAVSTDAHIDVEAGPTSPVAAVASAVEQASDTLLVAQHVAMDLVDAPADQVEKISHTTAVVRELVRRAAAETDVEVPPVAAAAAPAHGEPVAPSTPAQSTLASEPVLPAASTGTPAFDPASVPSTPSPALVRSSDTVAVDLTLTPPTPAVTSAAEAAVKAVAAELTDADAKEAPHTAVVVAAAIEQQTAALAELVGAPVTPVSVDPAPTPEEIAAAKAKAEAEAAAKAQAEAEAAARAAAERVAHAAAAAASYGNGQIPGDLLWGISWTDHELRADAAESLERLNSAFAAAFGMNLQINDGYRSYADQVAMKASRGYWAATPGHSNHGLAVAVDIGGLSYGNAMYRWLAENAGAYGWVNPDWAQAGGRKPEPWHWEYVG